MSTELEEQLRAGLKAAARQVRPDILRGLPEPGAVRRRRPGAVRWVAPAMAVLAVIAVLTGVRLAAGAPAQPSLLGQGGVPRYYVSGSNFPGVAHHNKIRVQVTATGAVVSRFVLPIGRSIAGIVGTGSGRQFVVSVVPAGGFRGPTTFETVTVSPGGHAQYRQLPLTIPPAFGINSGGAMTLSPDGSLLAMVRGAQPLPGDAKPVSQIELVSMRTGRVIRTWSGQPGWNLDTLSWVHGDQSLAVNYIFTTEGSDGVVHYFHLVRILDLARPGSSLVADSAPAPLRAPAQSLRFAIAVAGGSQFLVWSELPLTGRRDNWTLAAYDARTGRLLRVLVNLSGQIQADPLSLSADPTGRHLLMTAYGSFTRPGRPRPSFQALTPAGQELVLLSNGRLTARSVPGNVLGLIVAW